MSENSCSSTYSKVLFRSKLVTIGHFHLPKGSDDFQTAGAISKPTIVFPRTQMWIEKQNQKRYLSHPNLLNVYNGQQNYVRYQPHNYDDVCDWFEFSPCVISQAFGLDDAAEMDISTVFCSPATYLKQRTLVSGLLHGKVRDDTGLLVSMEILEAALTARCEDQENSTLSLSKRLRYEDIALRAEQYVSATLFESFSLEAMSKALAISPFHLCRIFKLINGVSILEFQLQLRLRMSLDSLARHQDIAKLALDNGFASHSHYSSRFKRVFGCTPRQFRQQIAGP